MNVMMMKMLVALAVAVVQLPTAEQVRAAVARGETDAAWALLEQMPVQRETLNLAVDVALTSKAPTVAANRLPLLADRAARISVDANDIDIRLSACAVVTRLAGSVPCAEYLQAISSGRDGSALDRARAWLVLKVLGSSPAPLPTGWEGEVRGASALELAAWPDLSAASRVRLLEPLLTSPDVGNQIAAMTTLQLVPGPEALAVWRDLSAPGRQPPAPSHPGARTQILVGLARHGDAESLKTLAPVEAQLSASDRLVLAMGRAERGDPAGKAALITMVNSGNEMDAVRAAEALASSLGPGGTEPRIESRVRAFVRDGGPPLRTRWLHVAARLNLGNTPDVVRHLTDDREDVRVAAAVAVAVAATRPPSTPAR